MLPNGFRLNGGGRVYLASKPADDFSDPSMWWQVSYQTCKPADDFTDLTMWWQVSLSGI